MMIAGVVDARLPMATLPNNTRSSRLGDFGAVAGKSGAEDRPAHSNSMATGFGSNAKPWGSIWSQNPLGTGFGSAARDTSRSRENGSFSTAATDAIEGKTGSGSLVASSESETWSRRRSAWGVADPQPPIPHARTAGVSPARQRPLSQAPPTQTYIDTPQSTSPYFSVPHTAALGQTTLAKPATNPLLDANTNAFTAPRQRESISNGFSGFGRFGETDTASQRVADATMGSWADAGSLHSPTDDRRSITNSEYFGPSSNAPSRSGSLPPSRHGADSVQYSQASDAFARYSQISSSRGHTASFSVQPNGRSLQERSGSIQSDTVAMFGRLSIDNEGEQPMVSHKPSVSVNGIAQLGQSSHDLEYPRDSGSEMPQGLARAEFLSSNGTFTPEGYPTGQYGDQLASLRNFQFNNARGALTPNGSDFRQSPYYSTGGTPPVYDHLYPSRSGQDSRAISNDQTALLQRKLRGLQQEQQTFLHPQYQQMFAAAQFRGQYNPYAFGIPNGMPLNGITPGMPMPAMPGMVPVIEPPKAPRDHDSSNGIRSQLLEEFKNNSKNRRYELKDLYDHIVEFAGDQHGSRFIQQKLETANSDEKDRVFKELYSESLQLMQDVFGNYVIQKFFEHGDQNQKKLLANRMKGQVLNLSLQMYGCRVVQKALEHILTDQQASLVKELEKDVLRCVKDQNGNHVIQKAIERVPAEHIQFIIDAFTGHVGQLATHPYGCRVIQRMLEHCQEPARSSVLQELHAQGPNLISDQYGNYVTQHIIEHGNPGDRAKVIAHIKTQLLAFSKHKFASNVVEKCLVFGTDDQRREIMMKVVEKNERGESTLMMLIKDGYGNYVIQKLLDTLSATDYPTFIEYLQPEMVRAKRSISGKQVQSVEKKMHRFDGFNMSPEATPRHAMSPTAGSGDVPPTTTPPLTNDAQSPRSSSVLSTNASTVDEPVQNAAGKHHSSFNEVGIANQS